MTKIKFDMQLMQSMNLFEKLTHAKVKDCIVSDELITFIVAPGDAFKAIGKGGSNVKRISNVFKKKIKIVEFSDDKLQFIKNFIMPLKAAEITEEEGVVLIKAVDHQTRGYIIGRGASSLNLLKEVAGRYFKFKDIKVV